MEPASARTATRWVKDRAGELGFDRCGIARPDPIGRSDYLRAWLSAGRAGSMAYLHRNLEARLNPSRLLPVARSAVVVALQYYHPPPDDGSAGETRFVDPKATIQATSPPAGEHADDPPTTDRGRVARYAWGRDYHRVVKQKLFQLADALRDRFGDALKTRVCVDTAPLIERELAASAGVGWIGKNTLVLHQELGSYFVLGVLLTTLELEPDAPVEDHCGSCTACLEACPTKAFPAPYTMDASRCLSYLTIEHRGEVPAEFHPLMGHWVFGCDVCQEVCPFNRHPPETREPDFALRPPGPAPRLSSILDWTQADYDRETRGSATRRATLEMWKRNAAIAAANTGPRPNP